MASDQEQIALLLSPEARAAYFSEAKQVAEEEFRFIFPQSPIQWKSSGPMEFLITSLPETQWQAAAKLSWVQGIFGILDNEAFCPLPITAQFHLNENLVFASKFKGKTNERLTQLLLNLSITASGKSTPKILDPMCGRATSLFWAMLMGFEAKGIEQDPKAIDDVIRIYKKTNKLYKQKLSHTEGFVGAKQKSQKGRFVQIKAPTSSIKLISGNSQDAPELVSHEKFDIILSDIPYGIQHHTTNKTRNPLDTIKRCAPGWVDILNPGGVITLSFNSYLPKRQQLKQVFTDLDLKPLDFIGSHRMSESIVREVLVLQKTR